MYDEQSLKWFDRVGAPRPTSDQHGVSWDDIRQNLQPMKAHSWTLEGNRLIGHTDDGDFINYIDPSYILMGTDENNLPILKKLDI